MVRVELWRGMAARAMVVFAIVVSVVVVAVSPLGAREMGDMVSYRLTMPVQGQHYFWDTFWGPRPGRIHHAQDIIAAKGVPVVAAASGTVRLVNWTSRSHMNRHRCCTLVIRHDDGWESRYIHLNNDTPGTDDGKAWGIAKSIRPGVRVKAGQVIGWVGDSGSAEHTLPHLHFELLDPSRRYVNPFTALIGAGGTPRGGVADPLFQGGRVMRVGDRGLDVQRLQETLNRIGYDVGKVDGVFGPRTNSGVRRFQSDARLTVDGLVGTATRAALKTSLGSSSSSSSSGILREGDRGDQVHRLQDRLKRHGFPPGPVDGVFGPRTLVAVISFQKAHNLRVDGLAGPQTQKALGM